MTAGPATAESEPVVPRSVTIVGTGSIGVGFAVLFAIAGMRVRAWDAEPEAIDRARSDIEVRLALLEENGLLPAALADLAGLISFHTGLPEALQDAELVQECAPEDIAIKQDLFRRFAQGAPETAVLASSSSALVPSSFSARVSARDRILGGHPGNPPYLMPVIELVPSPFTSAATVAAATELYRGAGLKPVLVRKEVEGFIFNRLQGALLREAYCLVRDGVATVEDIDEVVRSGLGTRWSVIGPFETIDLNTRGGLAVHARRMGPAYERMGAERGQRDPWTDELVELATAQRRALLPLDQWEDRVRWRDEQLMKLKAFTDDGSAR
jgi:3-hydroxyacyl-CoA dehydrogenase